MGSLKSFTINGTRGNHLEGNTVPQTSNRSSINNSINSGREGVSGIRSIQSHDQHFNYMDDLQNDANDPNEANAYENAASGHRANQVQKQQISNRRMKSKNQNQLKTQ